jgi:hypothetical protein
MFHGNENPLAKVPDVLEYPMELNFLGKWQDTIGNRLANYLEVLAIRSTLPEGAYWIHDDAVSRGFWITSRNICKPVTTLPC